METRCQPAATHDMVWPYQTSCASLESCPNAEKTEYSSLQFLLKEQTGAGTDCTPGSSYQQQGGQGHLGRLRLTTKHL